MRRVCIPETDIVGAGERRFAAAADEVCRVREKMAKSGKERLELIRAVQKELKYARFIHTMGVAGTAASLAARYGESVQKAETAGILHDCAKYMDVDKMETLCRRHGLELSEMEHGNAALLHSKAGSILAETKYGISDTEICLAIRFHTTGRPNMTQLEKIIFVSDYIEPGRDQAPHLEEIRRAAFADLDRALCMILKDTLEFLHASGKRIDPMTQKTYDYYRKQIEEYDRA